MERDWEPPREGLSASHSLSSVGGSCLPRGTKARFQLWDPGGPSLPLGREEESLCFPATASTQGLVALSRERHCHWLQ